MAEMLTPKPVARQSWPLTDRSQMFDALDELSAEGWRGGINCGEDGVWFLELNSSSQPPIKAYAGQRLVLEPVVGLIVIEETAAVDNYDDEDGS